MHSCTDTDFDPINGHHFMPCFFGKGVIVLDSKIILTVNQMLILASK